MRSIGNEAENEADREIENEAEIEVDRENMENPVEETPGESPGINLQPTIPQRWVTPVLEKSEAVKLVSFSIEKLTKHNVRDWTNQMRTFLRMQDC